MERNQPLLPQKSSSFSSSTFNRDEKFREADRNFSLDSIRFDEKYERKERDGKKCAKDEGEGGEEEKQQQKQDVTREDGSKDDKDSHFDLAGISEDIDQFLCIVCSLSDGQTICSDPPEINTALIEKFTALVEKEITMYDSIEDDLPLLDAIDRLSKLNSALATFSSEPKYSQAMNRTDTILLRCMSFLEEEFRSLLEDSRTNQEPCGSDCDSKTKHRPSFSHTTPQPDHCPLPSSKSNAIDHPPPPYQTEITERLRRIAGTMISSGYETECCQVFSIARRNAFEANLSDLGFEKISIDDVQKMSWESLEGEIATWIKVFRQSISISFPYERDLCEAVFSGHQVVASLFSNLTRSVTIQLLNFAEAVGMTKRSAEKLFKFLDIYETLRDLKRVMDSFFPDEKESSSLTADLKSEISSTRSRLGEAAVRIFCDLECSIKSDMGKTPVPGGAVHPLTRYVMNYLKYACEYKNTLEEVFQEFKKSETPSSYEEDGGDHVAPETNNHHHRHHHHHNSSDKHTPFAKQLVEVMDLLDSNLETKSKLYKDLSLSYIFLMNNGRYIAQKMKGSLEINELLGDTWCRKRSSDLRQYHKNYQRETCGKLLGCLKDEGLLVKGSVLKSVLKERFKSFNAMFEEIHKTQSSWVVSDEQLQSELRVSVSAVVVPAYRSFLGRFQKNLDAGRQSEKYIKFGPEDLETYIDELFDGNPSSMVRRRT